MASLLKQARHADYVVEDGVVSERDDQDEECAALAGGLS
jgi:hypothetical protein